MEECFTFLPCFRVQTIDASQLERLVESHEERVMNLMVWSSKTNYTRLIPITPSRLWVSESIGSPGVSSHLSSPSHSRDTSMESISRVRKPSLLGLTMRLCEPEFAMDNVWHILEVMEGSPAESAGLVPYGDWIVGWSGGVLKTENDFLEVVEAHADKPLRVYVYSYDFDTLREVVLVPNRMWGGEGLLGCGVGFGLLHRIPKPSSDAFQDNYTSFQRNGDQSYGDEAELFVPADDLVSDDVFSGPHPGHETHPPLRPVATPSRLLNQKMDESDEAIPTSPTVPQQPSSVITAADDATDIEVPTPTPSSPVSSQLEGPSKPQPLQLPSTFTGNEPSHRSVGRPSTLTSGSPSMLRQFSNPAFGANRFGSIQNRIPSPVSRSSIPRMAQDVDSDEGDGETTSTKRTSNGSVTSVDD